MSVNPVRDKCLIVYYSVGGNTKGIVNVISNKLQELEQDFEILALPFNSYGKDIESFSHVFIGSPTYGEGITPAPVLNFLRSILKENDYTLPNFSVFGSGDTQWQTYCRAVDEMEYHLSKKTKVTESLKIEQYPINKKQIINIHTFVEQSLRR